MHVIMNGLKDTHRVKEKQFPWASCMMIVIVRSLFSTDISLLRFFPVRPAILLSTKSEHSKITQLKQRENLSITHNRHFIALQPYPTCISHAHNAFKHFTACADNMTI